MTLPLTGLVVDTYEDVLADIISSERELISPAINVDEDTALGQFNMIIAARIALANEGLQDVYDQRNINAAEGKALDDAISWLGIQRQGAVATAGEQYFVVKDGTVIPSGSMIRNTGAGDMYVTNSPITITRAACRGIKISVNTVANSTLYSVTVAGTVCNYTSDGSATKQEIITGLVAAITAVTNITAVDNTDLTFSISSDDNTDFAYVNDTKLKIESLIGSGNVTCTVTGLIQAPAYTVDKIITPVNGWLSTYNKDALVLGRNIETDPELRLRAILTRTTSGKATVDSIKASVLNVTGVSSIAVNSQYVSMGDNINGQPAGSIQLTIAGGLDDDAIAQAIWDAQPAGTEVWAIDDATKVTGVATDTAGVTHNVDFNRPVSYPMTVSVTYYVFDTTQYTASDTEAYDAIKAAVLAFGNSLGSGEDVYASEFEGGVYAAVGGIYRVKINIEDTATGLITSDSTVEPLEFIPVGASSESYFDLAEITVTRLT